MKLVCAKDFEKIRNNYMDVIENTNGMETYARWKYGQHPTDEMLQGYIERQEMYEYRDKDDTVAGMVAITMYQSADYKDISWERELQNDEVAVLHILAVAPAYQNKGIGRKMVLDAIRLAKMEGKKAVRLDALASNTPARHMYEGLGFLYRGTQMLYAENTGWTDFYFYEFIL